jgi:hypothetical protein
MNCFSETEGKVYRNVAAKTEEVPPKLQGTHYRRSDKGPISPKVIRASPAWYLSCSEVICVSGRPAEVICHYASGVGGRRIGHGLLLHGCNGLLRELPCLALQS